MHLTNPSNISVSGDMSVEQLINVPPATAKPNVMISTEYGKISKKNSEKFRKFRKNFENFELHIFKEKHGMQA